MIDQTPLAHRVRSGPRPRAAGGGKSRRARLAAVRSGISPWESPKKCEKVPRMIAGSRDLRAGSQMRARGSSVGRVLHTVCKTRETRTFCPVAYGTLSRAQHFVRARTERDPAARSALRNGEPFVRRSCRARTGRPHPKCRRRGAPILAFWAAEGWTSSDDRPKFWRAASNVGCLPT